MPEMSDDDESSDVAPEPSVIAFNCIVPVNATTQLREYPISPSIEPRAMNPSPRLVFNTVTAHFKLLAAYGILL